MVTLRADSDTAPSKRGAMLPVKATSRLQAIARDRALSALVQAEQDDVFTRGLGSAGAGPAPGVHRPPWPRPTDWLDSPRSRRSTPPVPTRPDPCRRCLRDT